MVDTPRSSAAGSGRETPGGTGSGKRAYSSSPPPPSSAPPSKRSKAAGTEKGEAKADELEEKAPVPAAAEADQWTSLRSQLAGKTPAPLAARNTLPAAATGLQVPQPPHPGPWARLLSQSSETPHHPISAGQFSVGASEKCLIRLKSFFVGMVLCVLRRLEQPVRCQLEVIGNNGWIEVNGATITSGTKLLLADGDEVVFNSRNKHAYIFQYLLNDNEVPISVSAEENNQRVSQSVVSHAYGVDLTSDINLSTTLPPNGAQTSKDALKQGILSPNAIQETLESFPYYLGENTTKILLSTASIHMEHRETSIIKSLPEVSSVNPGILLSGPSGSQIYQETLIKALAKKLGARLLIVDSLLLLDTHSKVPESLKDAPSVSYTFRKGDRVKYIGQITKPSFVHRGPSKGYRGRVMLAFENNVSSFHKVGVKFDKQIPGGNDLGDLCDEDHGFFCPVNELRLHSSSDQVESLCVDELIQVISEESRSSTLIVLVKDAEKTLTRSPELRASLGKGLPPGVLIIASHTDADTGCSGSNLQERKKDAINSMKHLNKLFPCTISIELPEDETQLSHLKQQLRIDAEILRAQDNVLSIRKQRVSTVSWHSGGSFEGYERNCDRYPVDDNDDDDEEEEGEEEEMDAQDIDGNGSGTEGYLRIKSSSIDSIPPCQKIGSGGYGTVFKASIDGMDVAVKILRPRSAIASECAEHFREFETEVNILGRIKHPHLVRLIGACKRRHALVYEYLPNGTLEEHIQFHKKAFHWPDRIQVALSICEALIYLHSRPDPIAHGDLKPSNVLFDSSNIVKLGDFGISRILRLTSVSGTRMHITSGTPKGTRNYIDPEFCRTRQLTPHSDTFAFGVILLQLVAGSTANDLLCHIRTHFCSAHFHECNEEEIKKKLKKENLMDASLTKDIAVDVHDVLELLKLGLECCKQNRRERPSLANQVLPKLELLKEKVISSQAISC